MIDVKVYKLLQSYCNINIAVLCHPDLPAILSAQCEKQHPLVSQSVIYTPLLPLPFPPGMSFFGSRASLRSNSSCAAVKELDELDKSDTHARTRTDARTHVRTISYQVWVLVLVGQELWWLSFLGVWQWVLHQNQGSLRGPNLLKRHSLL